MAEVQAQPLFAVAFAGDFRIDLFGVIAALGNRLGAGFQASLDLGNLGIRVFQRIDPIPFGRQPVAGEVFGAAAIIAR